MVVPIERDMAAVRLQKGLRWSSHHPIHDDVDGDVMSLTVKRPPIGSQPQRKDAHNQHGFQNRVLERNKRWEVLTCHLPSQSSRTILTYWARAWVPLNLPKETACTCERSCHFTPHRRRHLCRPQVPAIPCWGHRSSEVARVGDPASPPGSQDGHPPMTKSRPGEGRPRSPATSQRWPRGPLVRCSFEGNRFGK